MTSTARPNRRFRPIPLLVSVLLALTGAVGVSAPAYAAGGVIRGTLIDQVGAIIEGVDIDIYSPTSPLGEAIMGKSAGDTATYEAPNGKKITVEIVEAKPF